MTTRMYREIADHLRQRIEDGEFESGNCRPSRTFRRQYGASRNTIREAIRQLTTLGLVETKPGQGTFVVPKAEPFLTALTGDPQTAVDYTSGVLGKAGRRPPAGLGRDPGGVGGRRGLFELEPGTEVISRHRKRFIDDVPWAMETSFYPGEFADRGADSLRRVRDIEEGTVNYLKNTIGVRQVGYRDRVTVRSLNGTEAISSRCRRTAGSR